MNSLAAIVVKRFALLAFGCLLAVATLVAVEGGLALLGVAEGPRTHDPFAGFSQLVPMFEKTTRPDGTAVYRTAAARNAPVPAEFLATKAPGSFRVFVVGGSTSAGTPYGYRFAFSAWLARRLQAALPEVRVEVVNAGLAAYASRRILAVVREIVRYEPDLLVVYSGHNEIAEARYYAHLTDLDPRLFRMWTWLAGTRLYTAVSNLSWKQAPDQDPRVPRFEFREQANTLEYFARITDRIGGAHESAAEAAYRELHYRNNIEAMIRAVREVGGEVLLATLSQNFVDWPPGASLHRDGLTPPERARWEELVHSGNAHEDRGDHAAALERYQDALEIDGEYAALHFETAGCHRALGNHELAVHHYRLASDLDRVPNGAPTRYNEILRELAEESGTLFADVATDFAEASPHGLVGDDWFTDLVHPNLRGHQRIAALMADVMREAGVPVDADAWRTGTYRDPPVEALHASDPRLIAREKIIRATACTLMAWRECALHNVDAVLAHQPEDDAALAVRRLALRLPSDTDRVGLVR